MDSASSFPECPAPYPKEPVEGKLVAFARLSAGAGVLGGLQYSYTFTYFMWQEFDLVEIIKESSGTGSYARNIRGISFELGGGASWTGRILVVDEQGNPVLKIGI